MTHKIDSIEDFDRALNGGPYAWPGGYPVFFVTRDSAVLSFETVHDNRAAVRESIKNREHYGWSVCAMGINWDSNLYCEHSGERIESAYGENEA